ncbi:baseplate J/gp47 family protein [Zobellella denitrificans]
MSVRPQVDFARLLAADGIPTTTDALEQELAREVTAAGSIITNDSRMSPFWRLQRAMVVKPALWLLNQLLVGHVLPNSFAATAKGYYQDLKAWDVGLERKPATATRGWVEFVKDSPATAVTIEAGTRISTERINGRIYTLAVVTTVVIPAGQASGLVVCQATEAGTAWNLPAGYYCILPSRVPGISAVRNPVDWITEPGDNEEDDDALGLRIQNQYSVVGRYHIDAVYRAMLAAVAGIRSDNIFFEHDAPRGPGTANAYILMEVGPTPAALIDKLNRYVNQEGNHGHGDDLQCFALPDTQHALTLHLWPRAFLGDHDKAQLKSQAEAMVRAAFRETSDYPEITRTKPFSRFSFSRLGAELHRLLPDLDSLSVDQPDIHSEQAIPRLSSLEVILHG